MLKMRLLDLYVYIYWGILMFGKGIAQDSSNLVFRAMTIFGALLVVLKCFEDKYSYKNLAICFALVIVGTLSYYSTGDDAILVTMITVIAFKDVDIEKIFRWSFWVRFIPFIIMISFYVIGIISMEGVYTEAGMTRLRYAFGYAHPNLAQYEFFAIFILYYLGHKGKISVHIGIAAMIFDLFLYRYTQSRTTVVCLMIIFALHGMCKNELVKTVVKKIAPFSYMTMAAVSFLLGGLWLRIINFSMGTMFSRFQTSYYLLRQTKLNLFGRVAAYTTDNGYVNTFSNYGIVIFALFIIGNTLLIKKCIKEDKIHVVIVLVTISICFMMERYDLSVIMNCALLYFSPYLFGQKEGLPH